jgi:hypothetical protein
MYATAGETREGLQKHLFAALSFSSARLVFAVALHLFLFLFPFLSTILSLVLATRNGTTAAELAVLGMSALCLLAMYGIAAKLVRAEPLPWSSAWLLPLSYFGMGAALWASVRGYSRGEIRWKGRRYKRGCGDVRLE